MYAVKAELYQFFFYSFLCDPTVIARTLAILYNPWHEFSPVVVVAAVSGLLFLCKMSGVIQVWF